MDPERYLNNLVNYEKTFGYDYDLDGFRKFLARLGKPHRTVKNVIQIAGTKGKGSVAALLHSCLCSCGYRVGLFTSPHLTFVNERIKINSQSISRRELSGYIRRIKPYIHKHQRARTYFEVLTAIAFLHFSKKNVDFTILETGLGGRLDSTSVTSPIISVITRIGYDHQHLLGRTLPEIAREKAGIIKPGILLITIRQRPSVHRVLAHTARVQNAPMKFSDEYHMIDVLKITDKGSLVRINGRIGTFTVRMPLIGRHHAENLLITLAILSELRTTGYALPQTCIRQGIMQTELRGRFDIVSQQPRIIFDCAHNHESFAALLTTIQDLNIQDFRLIFGTSTDKDFRYCEKYIVPRAREVILVKADHPRALTPELLAQQFRRYNNNIVIAGTMKNALAYVRARPSATLTTIITGSFYLWQPEWTLHT